MADVNGAIHNNQTTGIRSVILKRQLIRTRNTSDSDDPGPGFNCSIKGQSNCTKSHISIRSCNGTSKIYTRSGCNKSIGEGADIRSTIAKSDPAGVQESSSGTRRNLVVRASKLNSITACKGFKLINSNITSQPNFTQCRAILQAKLDTCSACNTTRGDYSASITTSKCGGSGKHRVAKGHCGISGCNGASKI